MTATMIKLYFFSLAKSCLVFVAVAVAVAIAMVKSNENGSGSVSVPPFLKKCYDMVEDRNTDSIIRWSDGGDSFVISDITQFSVTLLPTYFKHNNFSSFIRQLNIYVRLSLFFNSFRFCFFAFVTLYLHLQIII